MYLLSGGTSAVLEHFRAQADARIKKLRTDYQIDALERQTAEADSMIEEKKKLYADRLSNLRREYISKLTLTLSSVQGSMTPSSSALGDVAYYFTAKNNSDRIITYITYKPLIDGKSLSTTTLLVLEFIDPTTLKSGLGPHETMTNLGHDPEKFTFFIGEISQEEVRNLQKNFEERFGITIVDMHFSDQKAYKGQFKPKTFEEAFPAYLRPFQIAIEQAQARSKEIREANAQALREFNGQKNRILDSLKKSLAELKGSSVRYTASPGRKNRYVFDDIAPGTYFVYACDGNGKAVFEKISIGEKKQKRTYTRMEKDPFIL
ncbi:MAG TPA: hypothetical protein PLA83_11025 [Deltaproteobacteria bacterium]|nr:hypothetical protein [Deltaproteobacteria bacterium]